MPLIDMIMITSIICETFINNELMQRTKQDVFIRLFSAFIPAFIFINTLGILLTLILPGDKTTNLSYVITFAFLVYAGLVMWVFHTEKLNRMLIVLSTGIVLTSASSYLIYAG